MAAITRILVPTDFSAAADAALDYAVMLADRCGASVRLVHVFDDPFLPGLYSPEVFAPLPPDVRQRVLADSHRQLAERLRGVARGGTSDVVEGAVTPAILDAARAHGADLIVMGTHGRRGVAHALLGSVAERVVRTAPCPVLTVRAAAGVTA